MKRIPPPLPVLCGLFIISVSPAYSQCTIQALQAAQEQLYKTIDYIGTSEYPLATQPPANHWGYNSAGDDWNSGFFPGWLWYMYEQTLDSSLLSRAEAQTQNLSGLTTDVSQPLGYWLLPSYGLGYSVTRNLSYMSALQAGAGSFAAMWVSSAGMLNTQPAYHAGTVNAIIDDMPSIELLFYAAAEDPGNPNSSNWYLYAHSHALKMAQNNVRADGSTYQGSEYNSDGSLYAHFTINGAAANSTWSRGQAFGIYGFTMAYRYTKDAALLAAAQQTADYWIKNTGADHVPYWDYTETNYKDSSAAAIAAAGLLELSTYVTGTDPATNVSWSAEYSTAAMNIQASLSSSAYLGNTGTTDGILLQGAYYVPGNLDDDNSLIWGDYYFVQSCYRAMAPPLQVTGLTAGNITDDQVSLSWQAQTGAIRYNVKRATVSGGPYTVVAPPPVLTAANYNDTSVAPSTNYYYVVSASSVAGEGPNSAEIAAATPAAAPDFSLSASPASLSVTESASASTTITVSALNGFSGTVTVSVSSSPAGLGPLSCSPTAINGSGSCQISVAGNGVPAGNYTLTVTAADGTLTHTTTVALTVSSGGSFSIAGPGLSVSKSANPTATGTITVTSVNGFAGNVHLAVSGLPRNVTAAISQSGNVSVSPTAAGRATLTVTASRHASTGSYTITLTGTSSGAPTAVLKLSLHIGN